jgi:hypothetical protein
MAEALMIIDTDGDEPVPMGQLGELLHYFDRIVAGLEQFESEELPSLEDLLKEKPPSARLFQNLMLDATWTALPELIAKAPSDSAVGIVSLARENPVKARWSGKLVPMIVATVMIGGVSMLRDVNLKADHVQGFGISAAHVEFHVAKPQEAAVKARAAAEASETRPEQPPEAKSDGVQIVIPPAAMPETVGKGTMPPSDDWPGDEDIFKT